MPAEHGGNLFFGRPVRQLRDDHKTLVIQPRRRGDLIQRTLLAERFKLVTHTEVRLQPGYRMVADKKCVKFKKSDPKASVARPPGRVSFAFLNAPMESQASSRRFGRRSA